MNDVLPQNSASDSLADAWRESRSLSLGNLRRRQALRAELGFQKSDQILLYAGRITLEKNLQTQIRMLSILQRLLPNLHLVIIGQFANIAFPEAGVHPVDITGMFTRLLSELRLDTRRVHFSAPKARPRHVTFTSLLMRWLI